MKGRFTVSILQLGFFWMGLFAAMRFLFLAIYAIKFDTLPTHAYQTFGFALKLDASAMGYLTLPIVLLTGILVLIRKEKLKHAIKVVLILELLLVTLVAIGEACLYTQWKTKLNTQALMHLFNPNEVARSAEYKLLIVFFLLSILNVAVGYKFIVGWINTLTQNFNETYTNRYSNVGEILICLSTLVILVRGGIQPIPISRSDALFSNETVLNDAAVNPFWNLANEFVEYKTSSDKNPYQFMSTKEARQLAGSLCKKQFDEHLELLKSKKPNIIFIILESWSSHQSQSLGGGNFTPTFDSLAKTGLLFTNFFANAYISDQGIPAILSGQPGIPKISLINQASKCARLPGLAKSLKPLGYHSGFVFGGDLNYGNIKNYLFAQGFDYVNDEQTLEETPNPGRLGANDWEMAKVAIKKISEAEQPFLYSWFTVSSHSPYDIPEQILPLVNHPENDYVNAVKFTDKSLGRFFALAKGTDWYKNTLFVLVADHSHQDTLGLESFQKEYHHIPCLMVGEVVSEKFRGGKWDKICGQNDLAPSILGALGCDNSAYSFGKNIFSPGSFPSAFIVQHLGFGLVTEKGFYSVSPCCYWYGCVSAKSFSDSVALKRESEAMMQSIYEDYLKR
jgi:hypothetical protein